MKTVHEPILVLDRKFRIVSVNEAFLQLSGLSTSETEGRRLDEINRASCSLRQRLGRLLPDAELARDIEVNEDLGRGGRRRLLLNARRIDPLEVILLVIEDVTAQAEEREQRRLLLAELEHRVKNMLAQVQSVAAHTGRRSPSVEQFMIVFSERLRALGHLHDLVVQNGSSGTDVAALVEQALAEHSVAEPLEIEGDSIRLNARQGQTLGLTLHELASNAVRHGALSVPAGRLRIAWRTESRDDQSWFLLSWRESEGPKVTAPAGAGFGRVMMERACTYELSGTADLRFEPDGLRYELAFPLE